MTRKMTLGLLLNRLSFGLRGKGQIKVSELVTPLMQSKTYNLPDVRQKQALPSANTTSTDPGSRRNTIDSTKRHLLESQDWLGLSDNRSLKIAFDTAERKDNIGKRRRLTKEDRSRRNVTLHQPNVPRPSFRNPKGNLLGCDNGVDRFAAVEPENISIRIGRGFTETQASRTIHDEGNRRDEGTRNFSQSSYSSFVAPQARKFVVPSGSPESMLDNPIYYHDEMAYPREELSPVDLGISPPFQVSTTGIFDPTNPFCSPSQQERISEIEAALSERRPGHGSRALPSGTKASTSNIWLKNGYSQDGLPSGRVESSPDQLFKTVRQDKGGVELSLNSRSSHFPLPIEETQQFPVTSPPPGWNWNGIERQRPSISIAHSSGDRPTSATDTHHCAIHEEPPEAANDETPSTDAHDKDKVSGTTTMMDQKSDRMANARPAKSVAFEARELQVSSPPQKILQSSQADDAAWMRFLRIDNDEHDENDLDQQDSCDLDYLVVGVFQEGDGNNGSKSESHRTGHRAALNSTPPALQDAVTGSPRDPTGPKWRNRVGLGSYELYSKVKGVSNDKDDPVVDSAGDQELSLFNELPSRNEESETSLSICHEQIHKLPEMQDPNPINSNAPNSSSSGPRAPRPETTVERADTARTNPQTDQHDFSMDSFLDEMSTFNNAPDSSVAVSISSPDPLALSSPYRTAGSKPPVKNIHAAPKNKVFFTKPRPFAGKLSRLSNSAGGPSTVLSRGTGRTSRKARNLSFELNIEDDIA